MKKSLFIIIGCCLLTLYSCGNKKAAEVTESTVVTANGITTATFKI